MSLVSETGSEPVTLSQAKAWAKIENSDEDTLITSLITSCRREIESYTKNALINQTWQTKYIADKQKTLFYSPRFNATSVSVTIDGEATTDYLYNNTVGRLRLNTAYLADEVILITWTIIPLTSSLSPLTQALLDLITYRFYNRGASDIPMLIASTLNQYRVFNV